MFTLVLEGMLSRNSFLNGAIWRILSVPKYVIIYLKSTIFRIINPQSLKLFDISFYNINADEQISTKVNTFTFDKGGLGSAPKKPKVFFKKINEMEAFPLR